MGIIYKQLIRPLLFKMDPEIAHERGIGALKLASDLPLACPVLKTCFARAYPEPVHCFGLSFPNPVGLAAGMDKDALAVPALAALGFGFVEVGTVTPEGQPGNPKPRMFRFPEQEALINRMGFNNRGAEAMRLRLESSYPAGRRRIPVGINIGKARETPLEKAVEDYLAGFRTLTPQADFFVVNVSSPNTRGLRELQEKDRLADICRALADANREQAEAAARDPWPLLLKVAPDCSWQELDAVLEVLLDTGFAGIVATNTTVARPGVFSGVEEAGGLSGLPVQERSTEVIAHIVRQTGGKLPVIGVGGIHDVDGARAKLDAGASLIQVYTGFVYGGPGLPGELVSGLARVKRGRKSLPARF